jgi:hypothetical protein
LSNYTLLNEEKQKNDNNNNIESEMMPADDMEKCGQDVQIHSEENLSNGLKEKEEADEEGKKVDNNLNDVEPGMDKSEQPLQNEEEEEVVVVEEEESVRTNIDNSNSVTAQDSISIVNEENPTKMTTDECKKETIPSTEVPNSSPVKINNNNQPETKTTTTSSPQSTNNQVKNTSLEEQHKQNHTLNTKELSNNIKNNNNECDQIELTRSPEATLIENNLTSVSPASVVSRVNSSLTEASPRNLDQEILIDENCIINKKKTSHSNHHHHNNNHHKNHHHHHHHHSNLQKNVNGDGDHCRDEEQLSTSESSSSSAVVVVSHDSVSSNSILITSLIKSSTLETNIDATSSSNLLGNGSPLSEPLNKRARLSNS